MPIRKVRGGFKWGGRGKVYRSRAGAARQAAAAHAKGFRGDSKIVKHRLAPPPSAENVYARALKKILAQVHAEYLRRFLKEQALHQDALTPHTSWLDTLGVISVEHIKKGTGKAFDKMAASVNGNNRKALRGIAPSDLRLGSTIQAAKDKNVQYMVDAGRAYAEQVRDVLESPEWQGKSESALAAEIQSRADVSLSRAELIARTSTTQLNTEITKVRSENAGVTKFVWSTSQDERVRPDHAVLEGEVFDFATGAPSLDGLLPGQDFNCRCVCIPQFQSEDDSSI